ncbi:heterokaryon incompatibility protein-domain-containing protein [Chiua virens]|nr:heterokaryon incompatibility protein-domain-containing protein [Chiua virens]
MPARLLDIHDLNNIRVIDRAKVYDFLLQALENYDEEKVILRIKELIHTKHGALPDRSESSSSIVEEIARYAILSHRWLDMGEVTFNQDLKPNEQCDQTRKEGLKKLLTFCEKAKALGCSVAWADTCCIDKTSSSELDEAIRSMFRWYRNAYICVVYLAGTSSVAELNKDKWFTRGWTLQELLAPPRLRFFKKDWEPLSDDGNDKHNQEIAQEITRATTITQDELQTFEPGPFDIVRRMGWAAGRDTTRVEDRAYALIGMFDVSLIIAYGEGENAFGRLIKELYNKRPHYEVFLWEGPAAPDYSTKGLPARPRSYLAYEDRNEHDVKDDNEDEGEGKENDEEREEEEDIKKNSDRTFKESHRQTRESAESKVDYGDTSFALTNRGLRIKCLDVWVTLRVGHDPVQVDGKWKMKLRPWHPLSRDIEDVEVLVDEQTRDKFTKEPNRYSKAIGVLDYLRNESDQPGYIEKMGRLLEGREHFGWLMMCPTGHAEGWSKVMTYNTVRLRFKERWGYRPESARTIERPLIQVHL